MQRGPNASLESEAYVRLAEERLRGLGMTDRRHGAVTKRMFQASAELRLRQPELPRDLRHTTTARAAPAGSQDISEHNETHQMSHISASRASHTPHLRNALVTPGCWDACLDLTQLRKA